MKRPLIYVAGPLGMGASVMPNARKAIDFGRTILDEGGLPFVPHNFVFWHFACAGSRRLWMESDLAYIEHCEALVRMVGESNGSDEEVTHAKSLGILVFDLDKDGYDAHRSFWEWLKARVGA